MAAQVREYEITKGLDHPRVVRLLDIFEIDDHSFGTVQEVCGGGDLDWHLRQHLVRLKPYPGSPGCLDLADVQTSPGARSEHPVLNMPSTTLHVSHL